MDPPSRRVGQRTQTDWPCRTIHPQVGPDLRRFRNFVTAARSRLPRADRRRKERKSPRRHQERIAAGARFTGSRTRRAMLRSSRAGRHAQREKHSQGRTSKSAVKKCQRRWCKPPPVTVPVSPFAMLCLEPAATPSPLADVKAQPAQPAVPEARSRCRRRRVTGFIGHRKPAALRQRRVCRSSRPWPVMSHPLPVADRIPHSSAWFASRTSRPVRSSSSSTTPAARNPLPARKTASAPS